MPEGTCVDSIELAVPLNYETISPPGDVCPGDLWYEISNLDEALARGGSDITGGAETVRFVARSPDES